VNGLQIAIDAYECECSTELLEQHALLAGKFRRLVIDSTLEIVGEKWIAFPSVGEKNSGFTGTLLLAESHLAVHTWPECRGVSLDIFVCNFRRDNSMLAQELADRLLTVLAPKHSQIQHISRGSIGRQISELGKAKSERDIHI
jgi:spermidine synthase